MIKYLFTLLLVFIQFAVQAQNTGAISGKVIAKGGNSLEGVSIVLKENSQRTITEPDGSFRISGLGYGEFTVIAQGLGYNVEILQVVLSEETPTASVNFTLSASTNALQEVEVLGRKETTYKSDYSFIGTKTASLVIDVPQTISSVTKELMEDQQAFTLNDVVQNIAGVNQYSSYDDLTVRGFRNGYESGFRLVNGLLSGYSYGNGFFRVPLTANLERVEVLKGPGAALFGDINPGGTINMVTKKPLEEARKAVSFSVGSFQTIRSTLDFTGALNEDKSVLYRLNVGYENTKTFRDVNDRQSLMIAPTVTFRPTDNTTINAELVYSSFDGYLDRGLPIQGGDLFALPFSFAVNQPNDHFRVKDLSLNASLNHKINEWLSFNAAYMKFAYSEDIKEHRTLNTFADAPLNTVMNLRYFERLAKEYTDNLSAYFSLNRNTGSISHKIVLGADYVKFDTDNNSTMFEARQQMINGEAVPLTFDLKSPVYEIKNTINYIRRPLPQFFIDYINNVYHTTGLYVQDQLEVTNRLGLLLGLRYEMFRDERNYGDGEENIQQNVLLPRIGLTYSLLDNLNYFASYSQGFRPINPQYIKYPERYGRSEPFSNETSYQVEAGLKGEFFQKALFAILSLYQIEKRNTLVNTFQLTEEGNPIYRQNGRTRSQGVELELTGNILPNLTLNANYAFNHTEVLNADLDTENGMMAANAPEHSAGLWTKYTFTVPALRGIGVAVGGNYVSRRRMEVQVNAVNTGELIWDYWPAYTVVNAALFYNVNKFKFSFNLNNVLDRRYFVGGYDYFRASPGAPRNFMTTVGYTF
ncbi:TonB-dependent siderophore receptor [Pontibacter silvestris]|uniref:TonB-dependent siderophore receptor n=1 Tax=Pontibacter silvestris TaxID=2305183 RepID=A0ABW4X0W1_9BACT|nr:TonB-dependent receptor [Pontibacter silvestris]MCC9137560.1 TonB-dependent receptor [Pontibacter silvestris]